MAAHGLPCNLFNNPKETKMKKLLALSAAFALAACAGTWSGVKEDTARNVDKTESGLEKGWDKTKEAVRKGGNAVGRGLSHAGEKLENATAE
jgi:hypothetical protein